MGERALAIIVKETRELVRDPVYLGLAFVIPALLLVLLGYGFTFDVNHLPVAIVDQDGSPASREYVDAYVHSEYFDLVAVVREVRESDEWLRSGRARVIIEIPSGFARALTSGTPTTLGVTVDGSFPMRAEVIAAYVEAINALYNQRLLELAAPRGAGSGVPATMSISIWYNPTLESKNFVVPGMIVIILMIFPTLLGSQLITREKEAGTIFNLYAAPVGRAEILLGKAVPYVAVAFVDYLLIFAMSRWLFDVRFVGSVWVLSAGALLYSACTIGVGLTISVLTRTQLAAMLITFLATVTPAFNYSGFRAPVASQDAVGQTAAALIPATYFMNVVRGSYLKGLGFGAYAVDLGVLGGYTILVYGIAWLALRKRLG